MLTAQKAKPWVLAGLGLTLAAIGLMTVWTLFPTDESPRVSVAETEPTPIDGYAPPTSKPLTSVETLRMNILCAQNEGELLVALDVYSTSQTARSDSQTLANLALTNESATVRRKAFAVALGLARAEGGSEEVDVLRRGVANPHSDVRRDSVRACRDRPRYELLEDLLALARQDGPDRSVAIEALAFMDDPHAQQAVLDTARSERVSRSDRIQAIALLALTDLDEGVTYLNDLAAGEDQELRKFAIEALATRDKTEQVR